MFRLHLAASENDLKKWKNISVGISPIFSLLKSAFHTIQLRPPKSINTLASASSIGSAKPYRYLQSYDAHLYANRRLYVSINPFCRALQFAPACDQKSLSRYVYLLY